ncbi:hypothetical protein EMCG_06201 [[Emmonsia] crescens]|uniref:Uncharacterized protein n=1 Tax=[Emmonsia] crescens TaxID=73230 RepID=A0A0G2J726_9EURO|nr:hypothetical protein EMCG_06201 [Emmonsia crescens UAMH 3008]
MSAHTEQVFAKLTSLLNQLAHFLNDNQKYLSPDKCKNCNHSLPPLEKSALGKIIIIFHIGEPNASMSEKQDVCGSYDDYSSGDPIDSSNNDDGFSGDRRGLSGGVKNTSDGRPYYKIFKVSVVAIPEAVKQWAKSHQTFFEESSQKRSEGQDWGAVFSKIHRREVNHDTLQIYRRFDLYDFFLSVQTHGYHDGLRWFYRARRTLASKIKLSSSSLQLTVGDIDKKLDLWVELGRGYAEWVKFNKHPGCLLLLPLDVSETDYTNRRYRKHIKPAAQHLIKIGFQNVMRERDLYALGDSIIRGLEERRPSLAKIDDSNTTRSQVHDTQLLNHMAHSGPVTEALSNMQEQMDEAMDLNPLFSNPGFSSRGSTYDISFEKAFNRNSTLSCVRPYESVIFSVIQEGNIPTMVTLLQNGQASIHDADPYGLGLLYVWITYPEFINDACKVCKPMGP